MRCSSLLIERGLTKTLRWDPCGFSAMGGLLPDLTEVCEGVRISCCDCFWSLLSVWVRIDAFNKSTLWLILPVMSEEFFFLSVYMIFFMLTLLLALLLENAVAFLMLINCEFFCLISLGIRAFCEHIELLADADWNIYWPALSERRSTWMGANYSFLSTLSDPAFAVNGTCTLSTTRSRRPDFFYFKAALLRYAE